MESRPPARDAGAARSFVLSGSLEHAVARLARNITPAAVEAWTPAGFPLDLSPRIHILLAQARQAVSSRRYRAACQAYDLAEQLAQACAPTILEMRRRREMAADKQALAEAEQALTTARPKVALAEKQLAGLETSNAKQQAQREKWDARVGLVHAELIKNRPELWRKSARIRAGHIQKALPEFLLDDDGGRTPRPTLERIRKILPPARRG